MLNFGASKPRVKGGARAPGAPPWIRTCWCMLQNCTFFKSQLMHCKKWVALNHINGT